MEALCRQVSDKGRGGKRRHGLALRRIYATPIHRVANDARVRSSVHPRLELALKQRDNPHVGRCKTVNTSLSFFRTGINPA